MDQWITINGREHAVDIYDGCDVVSMCGAEWKMPQPIEPADLHEAIPDQTCRTCLERVFAPFIEDEALEEALSRGYRPA